MSKKEILIVEDEESLMKLMGVLLTSRGFNVKGVTTGQAALDYLADRKPNLLLLDVMLPEVDGFEICRQIKSRESTKNIRVIMVTSKKSREDMERAEQVGADWYITKPFRSAALIETVQQFLSGNLASESPLPPQNVSLS